MVKIKNRFRATVIAFGSSGLPLGERDDLDQLAIIALKSQDPTLLRLFEQLPPLEMLLKEKTETELRAIPANPPANDNAENENPNQGQPTTEKNKPEAAGSGPDSGEQ